MLLKKSDLVDRLAAKGFRKKDINNAINIIFDEITSVMMEGDGVRITGFGDFVSRFVEEHEGNNGFTGEPVVVPDHYVPKFVASSTLRKTLRETKP